MSKHALWVILPIALAAGCNESSSGNGASAASASASLPLADAAPAASAKPRPAFGHHGGIAASLFHAAHDLTLTRDQMDSLDKIEAGLKADDDGIRTAMKAFRTDLLAGVRAGKLDTAKLTSDDAIVDKAISDHKDKEAAALDSLHTLLDPSQRAALVAAVRAKEADREARMAGWMKAKAADGGAVDLGKRRLERLTADLALDASQQKQVAAILTKASDPPDAAGMQARWDDVKRRTESLLTAFAGTTFDAKKADLTILPGKTAHDPMDHVVALFTQLLPILRPEQREKLAASVDRPLGAHDAPGAAPSASVRHPVDDIAFPFEEPGDPPPK
jgi:Spy/CpxP family protein refolding chaperone